MTDGVEIEEVFAVDFPKEDALPQTFYATVTDIGDNGFKVKGMEINDVNFRGNFYFKSTDKTLFVWRYVKIKPTDLQRGDNVCVTFIGGVEETDPAKISNVIRIQLLNDRKNF